MNPASGRRGYAQSWYISRRLSAAFHRCLSPRSRCPWLSPLSAGQSQSFQGAGGSTGPFLLADIPRLTGLASLGALVSLLLHLWVRCRLLLLRQRWQGDHGPARDKHRNHCGFASKVLPIVASLIRVPTRRLAMVS